MTDTFLYIPDPPDPPRHQNRWVGMIGVGLLIVMIHCQGYAHPKPADMTDAEHTAYHHGQIEAYEQVDRLLTMQEELVDTVGTLQDVVKHLQEKHRATSNRLMEVEIEQRLQRKREEVSCTDLIAFLVVIGGIVLTGIIIKRGLKRRRQIKR